MFKHTNIFFKKKFFHKMFSKQVRTRLLTRSVKIIRLLILQAINKDKVKAKSSPILLFLFQLSK
jgi:hypothetical protein